MHASLRSVREMRFRNISHLFRVFLYEAKQYIVVDGKKQQQGS